MIQAFYSGAIGAQQQMKKMEIQGNNIANVNTYGSVSYTHLDVYKRQADEGGQHHSGQRLILCCSRFWDCSGPW